ncbi:MAG TPA: VTC domain-containing protein, partial [Solirubrobacteraceae bacterium]
MNPATVAVRFDPLSLDELNARAALLTRVDRKYILDQRTLGAFADAIARDFLILEIATRKVFTYETVYFDSAALEAYHAHVQGRRRRYKLRTRRYVDSDRHVFEIKLKGPRGATVKHQLPIAAGEHGTMTEATERFAREVLTAAYGHGPADAVDPALTMTYRRVTLAAKADAERVTCDFGLTFGSAALAPGRAIV